MLQTNRNNFFTIPYIKSISESFLPIVKKYGYDVAYSVPNTLNKIIRRGKDRIDPMSQNDVVYKMSDIKKKNGTLSVISNHRLKYNHDMNWGEATILDKESSYVKRIVSEMVHIKNITV